VAPLKNMILYANATSAAINGNTALGNNLVEIMGMNVERLRRMVDKTYQAATTGEVTPDADMSVAQPNAAVDPLANDSTLMDVAERRGLKTVAEAAGEVKETSMGSDAPTQE
jgi:hypothetical protein